VDVLIMSGVHVPEIPSFDINGSNGAVEFRQNGPIAAKVGAAARLTFNTIVFDVVEPPIHNPLPDTTQLTASLSTKLLLLNTGLSAPTFLPFTSH
jgi:hypothetical protein